MSPIFFLGLSIGLLMFPLGFCIGFNVSGKDEIKKFNEKKQHLIVGVLK